MGQHPLTHDPYDLSTYVTHLTRDPQPIDPLSARLECMRCELLQSMIQGICPSRGFKRAGCTKAAERIDVLFGVKTSADPRNTVLDRGPHPPQFRCGFCHLLTTETETDQDANKRIGP